MASIRELVFWFGQSPISASIWFALLVFFTPKAGHPPPPLPHESCVMTDSSAHFLARALKAHIGSD